MNYLKSLLVTICLTTALPFQIFSQVTFDVPYGGLDLAEKPDGTFLIANNSSSLTHIDRFGIPISPIHSNFDHIQSVAIRWGGGYVIGGLINDTTGITDGIPYYAEIDEAGNTLALHILPAGYNGSDVLAIVESQLGGYAVVTVRYVGAGTTSGDVLFFRNNADSIWGSNSMDDFNEPSIIELSPGKFAFNTFGQTAAGSSRMVILDSTGVLSTFYLPDTIYGGNYFFQNGHLAANEQGSIFTGSVVDPNNYQVSYLARLDSNGVLIWQKVIDWGEATMLKGIVSIPGGGCVVAIASATMGFNFVKYDSNGDSISATPYPISNCREIRKTSDQGYIMLDYGRVVKFDSTFRVLPSVQVSLVGNNPKCQGESVMLEASAGYDYLWSSGDTTRSIVVNAPGSYYVVVFDPNTGLSAISDTIVIANQPWDDSIYYSGTNEFCFGDSVTLSSPFSASNCLWSTGDTSSSITVTSDGAYGLQYTDTNGCAVICSPITVSVYPTPSSPIISLAGNILYSSVGVSYQWFLNGAPLLGEVSQVILPIQSGNYTVQVEDSNGCTALSSGFNYIVMAEENGYWETIKGLSIYPIPAMDQVVVELDCKEIYEVEFNLRNLMGQTLFESKMPQSTIGLNTTVISTAQLKNGLYILEIFADRLRIVTKVLVQH